ncbi:hypothetical protein PF002_g29737 [Phytophthora fragariae]|uniref:Chromo domain-containing protein n=1 Tax=Phytophthora fragariae TaxID=53985 RepID=A0A6A3VQS9_9STRA|nr:hypothetical protein PF011_g21136 [Phytophthora fragariae]KAE9168955.1 hypothetical protein PF004_g28345 [Phytophthora fragariae]KAE9171798.1 hypothetical protein PF002_g29737 [Phytophthora fragariae]
MATHPTFYVGLLKPYRPAGAAEPEEPTASQNTDGRRSPSSEQALPREAGQEPEQEQERVPLRGVPPGLQATHPIVQSVNPVKVPLQALTRLGIVLLAFRTSCPQPDSLLVKLPRQIPHEISQKVQVPADILEPLQAGLRILNASAKRRHVRPLAIQQSLTRLHTGEKALQAPPPLLGNKGVLYYHVERLLKRRGRSGQYQYLVKWRGYPSSRNSWEPGARLEEDCADLVVSFESVHGPGRR